MNKKIKIAIVGSRKYKNLNLIKDYLYFLDPNKFIIISGGAAGVDIEAEKTAKNLNFQIKIFYPDWKTYGKIAGLIRNSEIVDEADAIIAFWDGESRGTIDTIKKAKENNKEYRIYGPNGKILRTSLTITELDVIF